MLELCPGRPPRTVIDRDAEVDEATRVGDRIAYIEISRNPVEGVRSRVGWIDIRTGAGSSPTFELRAGFEPTPARLSRAAASATAGETRISVVHGRWRDAQAAVTSDHAFVYLFRHVDDVGATGRFASPQGSAPAADAGA